MLWIFNGSVEPTQPGMIPGLGWRSDQGGCHTHYMFAPCTASHFSSAPLIKCKIFWKRNIIILL